jgi:hypothetical protein
MNRKDEFLRRSRMADAASAIHALIDTSMLTTSSHLVAVDKPSSTMVRRCAVHAMRGKEMARCI